MTDHKTRRPSAMEQALNANPPRITWRTTKGGIKVAVSVVDPHSEASVPGRGRRTSSAVFDRDYLDRLTAFAAVVAAEEAEPEDETLMNEARTEI